MLRNKFQWVQALKGLVYPYVSHFHTPHSKQVEEKPKPCARLKEHRFKIAYVMQPCKKNMIIPHQVFDIVGGAGRSPLEAASC